MVDRNDERRGDRDERLNTVIAEYYTHADLGRPLGQAELAAAHPDLADDLAEFFADFNQFDRFVSPLRELIDAVPRTPLPRSCGRYELIEEIGRGGMGVVFKARQAGLDRTVAVKMVSAANLDARADSKRLCAEASIAAGLRHPNIVAIHEVGVHDGQHFFSMDHIEGHPLSEMVCQSPLPPQQAALYVRRIADAVHYAHERGVLHRDLKPSNVLIDGAGQPHVTDFGLAKRIEDAGSLTTSGTVIGTPSYMAPEQAAGRTAAVGPAADVYSLGAILYELLTSRPPFRADSRFETLQQVMHAEPPSARLVNPRVPADLSVICAKCLEKEPRRRYASAEDLSKDLARFLSHEPIVARPVGTLVRAMRWCLRNPLPAALAAAIVVCLVGVAVVAAVGYSSTSTALHELETSRHELTRERDEARRNLYASHINQAAQAWESGNVRRAWELLDAQRSDGAADLRQWEWYYLAGLLDRHEKSLDAGDDLLSVAYGPSGDRLAGGDFDGTITIWNAASGEEIARLRPHERPITQLLWTPDGSRIVSADRGGKLAVSDAASGKLTGGHDAPVPINCLAVDSAGTRLVAGGGDGSIYQLTIDAADGLKHFASHGSRVTGAAWLGDTDQFVTAASDGTLRVWNTDGETIRTIEAHDASVRALCASRSGEFVATASSDRTVKIWNVGSGRQLRSIALDGGLPQSLVFSPDDKRIAAAGDRGVVTIHDVSGNTHAGSMRGHQGPIYAIDWSPDGVHLATASYDKTAKTWVVDAHEQPVILRTPWPAKAVAWHPGGQQVAVASNSQSVQVWRLADRTVSRYLHTRGQRMEHGDEQMVSFSPDGQHLAFAGKSAVVSVWRWPQGELAQALEGHQFGVNAVCFSADGDRMATAGCDGRIVIWNARSGAAVRSISVLLGPVLTLAWHPGKDLLAAGDFQGRVTIWNAASGEFVRKLPLGDGWIRALDWSSDGRRIAAGNPHGEVRMWDADSGSELALLVGHTHVQALAFSPDSRRLATGGADGTIKIWNANNAQELLTLSGHTGWVYDLAWSGDGWQLASASSDRTLRIWDARPGLERNR